MSLIQTEIVAAALSLLPYVVHVGFSERITQNGIVTSDYTLNVAGIILAVIAIDRVRSAWPTVSHPHVLNKSLHRIVLVSIFAFAFYQVLRSCGIFSMAGYYLSQYGGI